MADDPLRLHATVEITDFPRDSHYLIAILETAYPARCILPHETPESAHRYAGLRELVEHLIVLRDDQIQHDASDDADNKDPLPKVLGIDPTRQPLL